MTIQTALTPDNVLLADAVASRMGADAALTNARSALWKFIGVGTILGAMGIATGGGLFAYAKVNEVSSSHAVLTTALTEALEKIALKVDASGEVKATGTVSLAPDQIVALEQDAKVSLDPNAKVKVTGQVSINIPAPPPSATPARAAAKVVTDFTVFKSVEFGKGRVDTGWKFATSSQLVPTFQSCSYIEEVEEGAEVVVVVGRDGAFVPQSKPRPGVNAREAFNNCVWFKGRL
jgi:hypothetical protein